MGLLSRLFGNKIDAREQIQNTFAEYVGSQEFRDLFRSTVLDSQILQNVVEEYMDRLNLEAKMESFFEDLFRRYNVDQRVQETIFTDAFRKFVLDLLVDFMVERLSANPRDLILPN